MLPPVGVAIVLPVRSRPGNIRPIDIGQGVFRLITKALLPTALSVCQGYLARHLEPNGVCCRMDATVRDAWMCFNQRGSNNGCRMVSMDASSTSKITLDGAFVVSNDITIVCHRSQAHALRPSGPVHSIPNFKSSLEDSLRG